MPESVSLLKLPCKIKKSWLGTEVPWESQSYREDYVAAESVGGVFDLSSLATIELSGKDTADYLQRMTTVNFKTLPDNTATYGAFLTGKGTVISMGLFIRAGEKVRYLTSEWQREKALEHIEKFHFSESFSMTDRSNEFAVFGIWNPQAALLKDLHLETLQANGAVEWRRWKSLDLELWRDSAREKLYYLGLPRKGAEKLLFEFNRDHLPLLGYRVFESLRIRAGVPELGVDLLEENIILESGFDVAVHRNKGCYPGQEVVERIFTYGSVNKKMVSVEVEGKELENCKLPRPLEENGKVIGELVSLSVNPRDNEKGWGLAMLKKEHWELKGAVHLEAV